MIKLKGLRGKSIVVENNMVRIITKIWPLNIEREKSFPIKNINSLEIKKPGLLFYGFIQISLNNNKINNNTSKARGMFSNLNNDNLILFHGNDNYDIALRIRQYIQGNYENKRNDEISIVDEILRLKRLYDNYIITYEEFHRQKNKLLNK